MKYAYTNGIILDGSKDMEPKKDLIILTNGEKIENIVPKGTDINGYEEIDLQGQYIMPGLINMHIHLPSSGKPVKKQKDATKMVKLVTSNNLLRKVLQSMCEGFVKSELLSGCTTVRTVGGVENYDAIIRDRVNKGEIVGPRILAGNMAVSVPEGHMAGSLAYIANNEEEARKYVREIADSDADLVKLMITGGVLDAKVKGEPGELKMPPEVVKASCDEAHKLGLKVAAHVESPEGVKVALANGVDTIEHGAMPDAEMINLFKETGSCLVATLSPALPFALFDREISNVTEVEHYNGKVVFDGIVECAKTCLKEGIKVGLGTDTGCPYSTHYNMWRELNFFHKFCGVSNAFALYTATKQNAEIAGLGDVTGSIEVGKCADFIATKENPLDNLEALRNLTMVVTRGKVITNPKVKKMKKVETELDKFL